tara:strand:- start:114 stop:1001 length:888 start_codon:yes stop_codon:yes gene_type:complete
MRNLFINQLTKEAKKNKKIVLVVGDLGFNVVEPFKKQFPNRFFNAGVSEQSMMGIACGLASKGFHVFVYSIANFPTFRCAEQIRNDMDYHNLPVTIVSIGSGLGYGNLGYSHHALQDYALMRSFPNTVICSPNCNEELISVMNYIFQNPQPTYLRLDKSLNISVNLKIKSLKLGSWVLHQKGTHKNKILLSTGSTLKDCADLLLNDKRSWYSIPIWGMKNKSRQLKKLDKYKSIITIENHFQDGGFGSWINEIISTKFQKKRINVLNRFISKEVVGSVGSEEFLNKKYGPVRKIK